MRSRVESGAAAGDTDTVLTEETGFADLADSRVVVGALLTVVSSAGSIDHYIAVGAPVLTGVLARLRIDFLHEAAKTVFAASSVVVAVLAVSLAGLAGVGLVVRSIAHEALLIAKSVEQVASVRVAASAVVSALVAIVGVGILEET